MFGIRTIFTFILYLYLLFTYNTCVLFVICVSTWRCDWTVKWIKLWSFFLFIFFVVGILIWYIAVLFCILYLYLVFVLRSDQVSGPIMTGIVGTRGKSASFDHRLAFKWCSTAFKIDPIPRCYVKPKTQKLPPLTTVLLSSASKIETVQTKIISFASKVTLQKVDSVCSSTLMSVVYR